VRRTVRSSLAAAHFPVVTNQANAYVKLSFVEHFSLVHFRSPYDQLHDAIIFGGLTQVV
jgi:hypothetical protein